MAAVTEKQTANLEMHHPAFEVVQFVTAASGDTYLVKQFAHVDAAWACQSTADGQDLQISWALTANGQPQITITTESEAVVSGYLVIVGRL